MHVLKNVLIVGSGVRAHALVRFLRNSSLVDRIHAIPGSAGLRREANPNHFVSETDTNFLINYAQVEHIDLVVILSEDALAQGMADAFRQAGIAVCGPTKEAVLALQGQRLQDLLQKYQIPSLDAYPEDESQIVTLPVFTDGKDFVSVLPVHLVRRKPGDATLTEGLAALTLPVPWDSVLAMEGQIVAPLLQALASEGHPFAGCLSLDIQIKEGQPRLVLLEPSINDTLAPVLSVVLDSDALDLFQSLAEGRLPDDLAYSFLNVCCLMAVDPDYPKSFHKGADFSIDEAFYYDIFAGQLSQHQGALKVSGGRLAATLGQAEANLEEAIEMAYDLQEDVHGKKYVLEREALPDQLLL